MYDIKELVTTYCGNLIVLCVADSCSCFLIIIDLMQVCFLTFFEKGSL